MIYLLFLREMIRNEGLLQKNVAGIFLISQNGHNRCPVPHRPPAWGDLHGIEHNGDTPGPFTVKVPPINLPDDFRFLRDNLIFATAYLVSVHIKAVSFACLEILPDTPLAVLTDG